MMRNGLAFSFRAPVSILTEGSTLSRTIVLLCALQFASAAASLLLWLFTGNEFILRISFQETGGPLLAIFAMVEAAAAFRVWSLFSPGEPLRTGWF